jgi:DNA-directed RNA polymerase subunit RPC12/RpoP
MAWIAFGTGAGQRLPRSITAGGRPRWRPEYFQYVCAGCQCEAEWPQWRKTITCTRCGGRMHLRSETLTTPPDSPQS